MLRCLEEDWGYLNKPTSVKFNPVLKNKLAVGLHNGNMRVIDLVKKSIEHKQ